MGNSANSPGRSFIRLCSLQLTAFGFALGLSAQAALADCPASAEELSDFMAECGDSECESIAETCNGHFTIELLSVETAGSIVTYEYEVCRIGGQNGLSHVVFGIGCPLTIVDCAGCELTDNDPTTGVGGIKFQGSGLDCETFSFSIDKSELPDGIGVGLGCITAVTKAGNQTLGDANTPGYACVQGPVCGEEFVEAPTCSIAGDEATCEGTEGLEYTATTDATNASYDWEVTFGDAIITDGNGTETVTVDAGEEDFTLQVTITDEDSGESSTCTIDVTTNSVEVEATADGDITCNAPEVEVCAVHAVANPTFEWSGPDSFTGDTECVSVSAPGEYCVIVTDNDTGCSATACVTVNAIDPPSCEIEAPESAPDCGSADNTLSASVTGGEGTIGYAWSVTGDGWEITDGDGTDTITYTAGEPGTAGTFTLVVTDELGCESECSLEVMCMGGELFCSYTQGFYGNKNGLALELELLDGTDLVIGVPGRSLTITLDGVPCLNSAMPMGGTAGPLPDAGDLVWNDASCIQGRRDRFGNVLIGQTIALALNVMNDPGLCDLELCAVLTTQAAIIDGEDFELDPGEDGILFTDDDPISTHEIAQEVFDALDALGLPQTVCGLLELANRAAGGEEDLGGASHSAIAGAAAAINEGFDECRILLICEAPAEE